mgnify:CR=1 FL=1
MEESSTEPNPKHPNLKHWLIGGFVMLVAAALAAFLVVRFSTHGQAPTPFQPNELEQSFFSQSFDFESYTRLFAEKCPKIEECPVEDIKVFVLKLTWQNVSPEEIPRVDEIKALLNKKLQAQKSNLSNLDNFWENYPTLVAANALGMLSKGEIDSWIRYLVSLDSKEFCPKIYQQEPNKEASLGKYAIPMFDEETYLYLCHLRWADTILSLARIQKPSDYPTFEYLPSILDDFETIKPKICRDLTPLSKKDHFNFLTGFGLAYVRNRISCNIPLTPYEFEKLKRQMDSAGDDPKTQRLKQIYQQFV